MDAISALDDHHRDVAQAALQAASAVGRPPDRTFTQTIARNISGATVQMSIAVTSVAAATASPDGHAHVSSDSWQARVPAAVLQMAANLIVANSSNSSNSSSTSGGSLVITITSASSDLVTSLAVAGRGSNSTGPQLFGTPLVIDILDSEGASVEGLTFTEPVILVAKDMQPRSARCAYWNNGSWSTAGVVRVFNASNLSDDFSSASNLSTNASLPFICSTLHMSVFGAIGDFVTAVEQDAAASLLCSNVGAVFSAESFENMFSTSGWASRAPAACFFASLAVLFVLFLHVFWLDHRDKHRIYPVLKITGGCPEDQEEEPEIVYSSLPRWLTQFLVVRLVLYIGAQAADAAGSLVDAVISSFDSSVCGNIPICTLLAETLRRIGGFPSYLLTAAVASVQQGSVNFHVQSWPTLCRLPIVVSQSFTLSLGHEKHISEILEDCAASFLTSRLIFNLARMFYARLPIRSFLLFCLHTPRVFRFLEFAASLLAGWMLNGLFLGLSGRAKSTISMPLDCQSKSRDFWAALQFQISQAVMVGIASAIVANTFLSIIAQVRRLGQRDLLSFASGKRVALEVYVLQRLWIFLYIFLIQAYIIICVLCTCTFLANTQESDGLSWLFCSALGAAVQLLLQPLVASMLLCGASAVVLAVKPGLRPVVMERVKTAAMEVGAVSSLKVKSSLSVASAVESAESDTSAPEDIENAPPNHGIQEDELPQMIKDDHIITIMKEDNVKAVVPVTFQEDCLASEDRRQELAEKDCVKEPTWPPHSPRAEEGLNMNPCHKHKE